MNAHVALDKPFRTMRHTHTHTHTILYRARSQQRNDHPWVLKGSEHADCLIEMSYACSALLLSFHFRPFCSSLCSSFVVRLSLLRLPCRGRQRTRRKRPQFTSVLSGLISFQRSVFHDIRKAAITRFITTDACIILSICFQRFHLHLPFLSFSIECETQVHL